jgi:SAM-dependent methyltransferase
MRQEECEYWDFLYGEQRKNEGFTDNVWKRAAIVSRLLEIDLFDKSILEIGVGLGTTFAAINVILLGRFEYVGTDVSIKYCNFVSSKWQLKTYHTDVTKLPYGDGQADIVVALDSMEHVHPDDRGEGNKEISRVLSDNGKIVMALPYEQTYHDNRFDHPYGLDDITALMKTCNMDLVKHDIYQIPVNGINRKHVWVVGERR